MRHDFPGNVRELENLIQRAVILAGDDEIGINHLQADWDNKNSKSFKSGISFSDADDMTLVEIIEEFEQQYISSTLLSNKGNISKTAIQLGLSRAGLYKKLKRYNIK